jgi:hypothetical protein
MPGIRIGAISLNLRFFAPSGFPLGPEEALKQGAKTERNQETKMNTEIRKKLETLAYNRSKPFCYHCYTAAPSGTCVSCKSNDLMRLVPGVGCEYGVDWVIEHILKTELTPVDLESAFEDSVRSCYPETTKVGWLEVDTVTAIKELDPISWNLAISEYADAETCDERIFSINNGTIYYSTEGVEGLL